MSTAGYRPFPRRAIATQTDSLWFIQNKVHAHLPEYVSTPANKVAQVCEQADKCIHDTIPVCGRSGGDLKTFLDFCDMLEYACDSNSVVTHIEDTPTCPSSFQTPNPLK